MQTAEIVRRLLNSPDRTRRPRPVTPERALKILHLLEIPAQRDHVVASLSGDARAIVDLALTEAVVRAHFARRTR
jgi:hypothetical protein